MIERRRSAHQNTQKIVLYTYYPEEPVKTIGQTVEKNYEFLKETSLVNKESNKTNGGLFRVRTREIRSKQT